MHTDSTLPSNNIMTVDAYDKRLDMNETGVGKICNFQPISYCISETVQDRTKVTTNN